LTGIRQRRRKCAAAAAAVLCIAGSSAVAQPVRGLREYRIVGDAIPQPFTSTPGDAASGRRIVADRYVGLCLLCHRGPFPEEAQGSLAPDLAGAGARWSEGQLRLRIVDARRLNPATIMPSYYRIEGLEHVGPAWSNQPVLEAQQIEDVIAFLRTLRD
jgi:L-cysteine S-thiosulfotransferase